MFGAGSMLSTCWGFSFTGIFTVRALLFSRHLYQISQQGGVLLQRKRLLKFPVSLSHFGRLLRVTLRV